MTKKSNKLINERVIRRWGKLANMPALTENFLDTIAEDEMEDELAAAGDEVAAGEDRNGSRRRKPKPLWKKTEAVEAIVSSRSRCYLCRDRC